jgi:ribosome-binding factor A
MLDPSKKGMKFMRKRSIKNIRVNAEVQRVISEVIRNGLKDPRVPLMTSVVAVEVAPDLKTCKVYLSVLGDEKVRADAVKGLNSAEGYIRRELAHELNLRNTPELTFIIDNSIEYGVTMSKKIDDVNKPIHEREREEQLEKELETLEELEAEVEAVDVDDDNNDDVKGNDIDESAIEYGIVNDLLP